jgi:hypothetical protein
VHTMFGSFLPPTTPLRSSPCTLTSPPTPSIPSRNYFALISNFHREFRKSRQQGDHSTMAEISTVASLPSAGRCLPCVHV